MALLKDKRRRIWFNLELPIKSSFLITGTNFISCITTLTNRYKSTSFLSIKLKDIDRDISSLWFALLLTSLKLSNVRRIVIITVDAILIVTIFVHLLLHDN